MVVCACLAATAGAENSETAPANGDTLVIPVGSQHGADGLALPAKGLKQDAVLARFGTPDQRQDGVGDPPISRWVYADFTVYFEGDTVLHSVINHHSPTAAK